MATTDTLYIAIVTTNEYIAIHGNILAQFDENEDPAFGYQRDRVMNLILNTKLLENHYTQLLQYVDNVEASIPAIDTVDFLTVNEINTLISRNQALMNLPLAPTNDFRP